MNRPADWPDVWRRHAERCDEAAEKDRAALRTQQLSRASREARLQLIVVNECQARTLRRCADELEQALSFAAG